MIKSIEICNTATFSNIVTTLDDLKKFNFFFGANGTGKTTISKIIAEPTQFPACSIAWTRNLPLETRVYNRDFVERNFTSIIKGVFTLGEQEADTIARVNIIKDDIDKLKVDIGTLTATLQGDDGNGGKKQELSQLEIAYAERFWTAKQKHGIKLAGGLKGFVKSKDHFKAKILAESNNNNADLKLLDDLEAKAAKVFSGTLVESQTISMVQPQKLLSFEQDPMLAKCIIGKDDVDIAAIIKKLGNSDWVRQGLSFYKANDGVCPFCQQKTDESFSRSLSEYFDETFERDSSAINSLVTSYSIESNRIQNEIQAIIDQHSEFIDNEKLESQKKLLDSIIITNVQRLDQKKREPSQIIELESLHDITSNLVALISSANEKINTHNAVIRNLESEKKALTAQIWKFIVEQQKGDITNYQSKKTNLQTVINSIETKIKTKTLEQNAKKSELEKLEKQIVSIQPTLDGINNILASFGFKNFSLAKGNDGKSYKLVRANGSDAHDTLSEGERNFVTFLYFYHLLKGSHTESGMTADRIVVFDDPVSSLDSDVLFIVSTLIRELFEDVCQNQGTIKQIFVLTHNVYFHKEVTYNSKRRGGLLNEESFWLIKKKDVDSIVERYTTNPIKTSYELLWEEIRSERRNNATIRNTLRRILESYFKLLGDIPLDDLYKRFNGDNKVKCKALCSWVHDGSHPSAFNDEHYIALDETTIALYLDVFRQIFEQCGHIAHYNMMMNIHPETESSTGGALA
jgi:wobble nucleotide-excising tRNase